MHDNEHHKPNLDALVSNAAQRRLQPSLMLEEIVSAPLTIAEHITSPAKPPQSSRARKNLIKTRLSAAHGVGCGDAGRAGAAQGRRGACRRSVENDHSPQRGTADTAPGRMGRTAACRTAGGAYGKAVGGVGGEDRRWLSSSIAAPKTPVMRMCWSTTPAGIGRTAAPDIMRQFWINTA